jgi:voltage-gated potassium channel
MLLLMKRRPAQSYLRARTERAVANKQVFRYLALVTLLIGVTAGVVMTLVDSKDFPTVEDGIWWAIVTLATVGYGDIVPTTTAGRAVGSVVIIFGVTFISFLTATVTSAFVSAEQEQARDRARVQTEAAEAEVRELLGQVAERLTAIEAKLDRGS